MKVAIIGSRGLSVSDFTEYLPDGVTEIVSGGARGVDTSARNYALSHNIKLTEFLPDYEKFGKSATHIRNDRIIDYSEIVLAFWDGKSPGTRSVIAKAKARGKKVVTLMPRGLAEKLKNEKNK